jgi:Flp pilus assembly pilin Flp
MIERFTKEERAQGGVEYILLAGGIVVAVVVVLSIYSSMVGSTAASLNESVGTKVDEIDSSINDAS